MMIPRSGAGRKLAVGEIVQLENYGIVGLQLLRHRLERGKPVHRIAAFDVIASVAKQSPAVNTQAMMEIAPLRSSQ